MSDETPAGMALEKAMALHQQGDLQAAKGFYTAALEADPDNGQALRLLGVLNRELGDIGHSLHLLAQAAEKSPASTAALNELALSHLVAGQLSEAEHCLRQSVARNPKDGTARTNLGALLQHRGHVKAAIDVYSALLDDEPGNVEVRCNYAKALVDAGETDAALAAADAAIEDSDAHPYALSVKGAVLTDLGRYEAAVSILRQANAQLPDDMALVNQALGLAELGDAEAAANALQTALELNPVNARAVADLANLLTGQNQPALAVQLCEEFLNANPGECLVLGSYAIALETSGAHDHAKQLTDCRRLVKRFRLSEFDSHIDVLKLNSAIFEQVMADKSLLSNPVSKSTSGGAQTGELNLSASAELSLLQKFFCASVDSASQQFFAELTATHPLVAARPEQWTLRTWATVLQSGGGQTAHMHPLGWLSAVYYAELPDFSDEADSHAGQLLFGPAPERFRQEFVTRHYEASTAGDLIVFPSWFWHQTIPFETPAHRVSLAFDVVPGDALRML